MWLKNGDKEILIPAEKDVVKDIDLAQGRINHRGY
jgi:ribosomal 30S subunit maturation factor RimM